MTPGRDGPTRRKADVTQDVRAGDTRNLILGYNGGSAPDGDVIIIRDEGRRPGKGLMSLPDDAVTVYRHLVRAVVRHGKVTTCGAVSAATGVPMGVRRRHMTAVLAIRLTDRRELPPITAVIVRGGSEYDYNEHGTVTSAYLTAEARSPNRAARYRPDSFTTTLAAGRTKFDGYSVVREFREMIERHQDSVWAFAHWPAEIAAPG